MQIALIVAMEEELQTLSPLFKNQITISHPVYKLTKTTFNNHEVIIIVSKIGKAQSSSATTFIIEKYNPDVILNFGTAGGLNDAKVGSIIVSNLAAYHDVDVTGFNYPLGTLPMQPSMFTSTNNKIPTNFINQIKNEIKEVKTGLIATGDSFINSKKKVEEIKTMYQNIIALDMEAASIAQIALQYNKDFILIKKISDAADEEASTSFKQEVSNINQTALLTAEKILTLL
jgi:adenosylhomocysteine nucleosidase